MVDEIIKVGYKNSKIGKVPIDWSVVKLGDVVKYSQGIQVELESQKYEPSEGYIKFLRIENYTQLSQDFRYVPIPSRKDKIITKDDIVVVRYGASAGTISRGFDGVLANNLFKISPSNKLDRGFLFRYMTSMYSYLQSLMSGGAMPALNFGMINLIYAPLPPLPEQKKIASILSTVDEAIQNVKAQIERTTALKKGLMQKLFSEGIGHTEFKESKLGRIPKEWEVVLFGDLVEIKSGVGFKKDDYSDNGFKLLRIDNVTYGKIKWNNIAHIPFSFENDYRDLILQVGDILLALNRPITNGKLKIGRITNRDLPSILYQRVGKLSSSSNRLLDDFLYYLGSYFIFFFVQRSSVGSDQPFINLSSLRKLKVPIPNLVEQRKIADMLSEIDIKVEIVEQEKVQLERLKKGLMQKLLTGEVRVKVNE